jgi:hypothetical protein
MAPDDAFAAQHDEAFRVAGLGAIGGDPEALVELLRGPGAVPEIIQLWLADLFDPHFRGDHVAKIKRRRRGPPTISRAVTLLHRFKKKPQILARLLRAHRDDGNMSPFLRSWTADLFDPNSGSEHVAEIQRRRRGKPGRPRKAVILAAHYVVANVGAESALLDLIEEGIRKHSPPGEPPSQSAVYEFIDRRWPNLFKRLKDAKFGEPQI